MKMETRHYFYMELKFKQIRIRELFFNHIYGGTFSENVESSACELDKRWIDWKKDRDIAEKEQISGQDVRYLAVDVPVLEDIDYCSKPPKLLNKYNWEPRIFDFNIYNIQRYKNCYPISNFIQINGQITIDMNIDYKETTIVFL